VGGFLTKKKWSTELWMLIPALLILAFTSLYPFVYLIRMSFMKFSLTPGVPSNFIGLTNWLKMFKDPAVIEAWIVTLKYYVGCLFFQILLGTGIALIIYRIKRMRNVIVLAVAAPLFLAPALVGLLGRLLLDPNYGLYFYGMKTLGFFSFLQKIGVSDVNTILGSSSLALPAVIAIDTWEWTPLIVLIVLAGLSNIPKELVEAASVDGAGFWQRTRYIELPLLKPAFIVALLIRTMDLVRFFDVIFITTAGGPANVTKILAMKIHETAFRFYDLGYASVLGITLLIITILLGNVFVKFVSRK
jgi:multiple sugar transport system permease protein